MHNVEHFALAVKPQLIAKMRVEEAADVSDAEIERTLRGCALGTKLVAAAKWLRGNGMLDLS